MKSVVYVFILALWITYFDPDSDPDTIVWSYLLGMAICELLLIPALNHYIHKRTP